MKLEITLNGAVSLIDLDALSISYSGIINIGQKCKQVWNTIPVASENIDPFQCHIIGPAGGPYTLSHGQQRTECPKGLISDKLIPCNGCMGRCVNIHAGRPKYPLRTPEIPTLVNGKPVAAWGTQLKVGDLISFADAQLLVRE